MNKKIILSSLFLMLLIIGGIFVFLGQKDKELQTLEATVLSIDHDEVTVQTDEEETYTFKVENMDVEVGSTILLEYLGVLDEDTLIQNNKVVGYEIKQTAVTEDGIPTEWATGIFSDFSKLAYDKLQELTLDEKISQLLLVRYPDTDQVETLENYQFAGYVFFEKDFEGKTVSEVKSMMQSLQNVSKVPILTAVDEEGGNVVRVSSNSNLADEKFKSPRELYTLGGFDKIKEDTINKSKVLKNLGINLNLAPVVDVSTDSSDYMYPRTLGEDTEKTSTYAKTVIEASKNTEVSYTLKHFPGYGNNSDTHTGSSTDTRTYDEIINNDIPPFQAGIQAGAEAVLISHNIVTSFDSTNPASLSPRINQLLKNDLDFTGVSITDDLSMSALSTIDNVAEKAVLAGNDLLITTDYVESIASIKRALSTGTITEDDIDEHVFKVLAWKYYKGLMYINEK